MSACQKDTSAEGLRDDATMFSLSQMSVSIHEISIRLICERCV